MNRRNSHQFIWLRRCICRHGNKVSIHDPCYHGFANAAPPPLPPPTPPAPLALHRPAYLSSSRSPLPLRLLSTVHLLLLFSILAGGAAATAASCAFVPLPVMKARSVELNFDALGNFQHLLMLSAAGHSTLSHVVPPVPLCPFSFPLCSSPSSSKLQSSSCLPTLLLLASRKLSLTFFHPSLRWLFSVNASTQTISPPHIPSIFLWYSFCTLFFSHSPCVGAAHFFLSFFFNQPLKPLSAVTHNSTISTAGARPREFGSVFLHILSRFTLSSNFSQAGFLILPNLTSPIISPCHICPIAPPHTTVPFPARQLCKHKHLGGCHRRYAGKSLSLKSFQC